MYAVPLYFMAGYFLMAFPEVGLWLFLGYLLLVFLKERY